jgi:hypothetical protein
MRLTPNGSSSRERRNRKIALSIVAAMVLMIAAPVIAALLAS